MNVTEGKGKDRQLHNEGHLQMVSAGQKEYVEASDCQRIAKNTDIITDLQMTGLLEEILHFLEVLSSKQSFFKNLHLFISYRIIIFIP